MNQQQRKGPNRPKQRSDAEAQIVSAERRQQMGSSFAGQSREEACEYDAVRPGYPEEAVRDMLAAGRSASRLAPPGGEPGISAGNTAGETGEELSSEAPDRRLRIVELGAGTGILTRQLLSHGSHVIAVEPSRAMLDLLLQSHTPQLLGRSRCDSDSSSAEDRSGSAHSMLDGVCATAEATGLENDSADMVIAATAWHWFEPEAVLAEIRRILRPGGALAIVSNHLDNTQEWVLRMARIMRAGDNYRPGFSPRLGPDFSAVQTSEYRWTRPVTPEDLLRLNTTLSSWISAKEPDRRRRRENLAWYLYEHLGHQPESAIEVPYITTLHIARSC